MAYSVAGFAWKGWLAWCRTCWEGWANICRLYSIGNWMEMPMKPETHENSWNHEWHPLHSHEFSWIPRNAWIHCRCQTLNLCFCVGVQMYKHSTECMKAGLYIDRQSVLYRNAVMREYEMLSDQWQVLRCLCGLCRNSILDSPDWISGSVCGTGEKQKLLHKSVKKKHVCGTCTFQCTAAEWFCCFVGLDYIH